MSADDSAWFTPTEAAVLTGLPLKAMNNAIDKEMVSTRPTATRAAGRLLDARALLALILEQRLEGRLAPELRRRLFAALPASPRDAILFDDGAVQIKINLREPRRALAQQIRALRRARTLVVSDPEILGGDPVFRGTRIPVHLIATIAEKQSAEAILDGYPRLTAERVRLARMYAQAYPLRGRPRKQPWHSRLPVRRVSVPRAQLKKLAEGPLGRLSPKATRQYLAGLEQANAFEVEELRLTPVELKLQQTWSLMTAAALLEDDAERAAGVAGARDRWQRIRKAFQ